MSITSNTLLGAISIKFQPLEHMHPMDIPWSIIDQVKRFYMLLAWPSIQDHVVQVLNWLRQFYYYFFRINDGLICGMISFEVLVKVSSKTYLVWFLDLASFLVNFQAQGALMVDEEAISLSITVASIFGSLLCMEHVSLLYQF